MVTLESAEELGEPLKPALEADLRPFQKVMMSQLPQLVRPLPRLSTHLLSPIYGSAKSRLSNIQAKLDRCISMIRHDQPLGVSTARNALRTSSTNRASAAFSALFAALQGSRFVKPTILFWIVDA